MTTSRDSLYSFLAPIIKEPPKLEDLEGTTSSDQRTIISNSGFGESFLMRRIQPNLTIEEITDHSKSYFEQEGLSNPRDLGKGSFYYRLDNSMIYVNLTHDPQSQILHGTVGEEKRHQSIQQKSQVSPA